MDLSELPVKQTASVEEMMQKLTGIYLTVCPCCHKGRMQLYLEIPLARPPNPFSLVAA